MPKQKSANSNHIGQRIKELRHKKGLTQKELGQLVECAQNTVAAWEKNKNRLPGKNVLGQLAQVLGVSLDYLLGTGDTKNPQIPCYGEVMSEGFQWDNSNILCYVDVPQNEFSSDRFALKIMDDLLEPLICPQDYGIFEKQLPEDGNIVIIHFLEENKAIIRKWRQQGKIVILCEINPQKVCPLYFFEIVSCGKKKRMLVIKEKSREKRIVVEGRLTTVKRVLKSVTAYQGVNYVFS